MVRREILAIFEGKQNGAESPKPKGPHPPKIALHAFHIHLYLLEFFELILFIDPHGQKGKFGHF